MMSISWISLPPDALRRMAEQEAVEAPRGRRWERVAALVVAALVAAAATGAVIVAF
jgi:hypothetical protein